MPLLGFFDDGFTITQGSVVATLAQPMDLTPTKSKRVETYVFRDKTTTSVDIGTDMDRLTLTGLDFLNTTLGLFPFSFPVTFAVGVNMMTQLNTMVDAGQRVYVENLASVEGLDSGYSDYYYITNFSYTRKAGVIGKNYYELVLDKETQGA
jgi:hypothetical protein